MRNILFSLFILALVGFSCGNVFAQSTPQIINVEGRQTISLDGVWKTIVDPFENGYYDYRRKPFRDGSGYGSDKDILDKTALQEWNFKTDRTLAVPGDWNTQRPELYYYEGTVWYRKRFDYKPANDKRVFLHFGAVNYEAVVFLNGKTLGKHVGGFTPFNYEVTGLIKNGQNSIVVKVDNKRKLEAVPTINTDWWNYGGITRQVQLIESPKTFVRDYFIQLKKGNKKMIAGWVQLDGDQFNEDLVLDVPGLKLSVKLRPDSMGYASFEVKAKPQYWSPENPKLYNVNLSYGGNVLTDQIGFRTIETSGTKILLNGESIFCRGICIHEEAAFSNRRAATVEEDLTLLNWAKEMGCNFVRLAHYPHNEQMVRQAEKLGLLVWSEIPCYWTIQWNNPDTYLNAENQLTDMITRDKNRANVIIWSIANETPHSPERLKFLTNLATKARELDQTRLIGAAMETEQVKSGLKTAQDELGKVLDLISFNQYIGWYDGLPEKCDRTEWTFAEDKPVFISEFGGGALYGYRGDITERFTEDYQEDLYIRSVNMLKRIPGLAGTTPWILKDFRSPRRQLRNIQDDFNRKGLISDKGQKKKAFFVMQKWYKELKEQYK